MRVRSDVIKKGTGWSSLSPGSSYLGIEQLGTPVRILIKLIMCHQVNSDLSRHSHSNPSTKYSVVEHYSLLLTVLWNCAASPRPQQYQEMELHQPHMLHVISAGNSPVRHSRDLNFPPSTLQLGVLIYWNLTSSVEQRHDFRSKKRYKQCWHMQ